MSKITGDITKMAAQVPALFETLSGMPLGELLGKVRQIGDTTEALRQVNGVTGVLAHPAVSMPGGGARRSTNNHN
jgi:hypothetical protein